MLTILMATRNRAQILREVLESYCRIVPPHDGWKLVVIDNGSTDETTQVLDSFQNRLPLQVLSESRPGKSCALNTGLKLAEWGFMYIHRRRHFPRENLANRAAKGS